MRLSGDSAAGIFRAARRAGERARLEPGTVVAGRFRIAERLGEGATGTVYVARDLSNGEDVALKVWRVAPLGARELEALCRLDHPNIARLVDAGEFAHEGTVLSFLATRHYPGRTLSALAPGELSPRRAIEVASAVAGALEHAHERGVLHRDLSPSNVLVAPDGSAALLDFGLAAFPASLEPADRARAILGAPEFLSPELARGEVGDARTDVHGLGGILFYLLAGRPPHPLGDPDGHGRALSLHLARSPETWPALAALLAAASDPPPSLATLPYLDPEIESIVRRALAPVPANRFPSTAELGRALDGYLLCRRSGSPRLLAALGGDCRSFPLDRPRVVVGSSPPAHLAIPELGLPRAFELLDTGAGLYAVPFDLALSLDGRTTREPFVLRHGAAFDAGQVRFFFRVELEALHTQARPESSGE